MKLTRHTARDYADALSELLPPGAAWDWPVGGMGDDMLVATSQELLRLEADIQNVFDNAVELHRPKTGSWHISEYQRVAEEALAGVSDTPAKLVQLSHLVQPARVGSRVGDRLWSTRCRYLLFVRYDAAVVDPEVLRKALSEFAQGHVYLWLEAM
ncbi:hypothetical protein FCJ61_05070 [Burkholderia metallica]|nr:hypothetical protein [Burkholderia metallica]